VLWLVGIDPLEIGPHGYPRKIEHRSPSLSITLSLSQPPCVSDEAKEERTRDVRAGRRRGEIKERRREK